MPGQVTRLITIAAVALLTACGTVTTTSVKNTSKSFNTVVVDAGHGGKDSGAVRRYSPPEKMIALDVAQRLNRKLKESQLKTVMTRNSDVFIELNDRVAIENEQKNAVFVSIHFNDSHKRRVRGFETYYHSGASFDMANRIQGKLTAIPNSSNGGVHTANFRVLRNATCPAVLVECGYLSNRAEGNKTRDWEYRELLADRIAEAIVEQRFGSGVYRPSTQMAAESPPQAESSSGRASLTPGVIRR
ncbi:MAG TPA: N-acetylmuramoyl-L-alanine amidase [Candidatus Udaeobacter sp.]|jgi:N-acetylmuramoyl-L-alanine amidase